MIEHNDRVQSELVSWLRQKRMVLMIGAGSSRLLGYPGWDQLLSEIHSRFTPDFPRPPGMPLEEYADEIRGHILASSVANDYYNFLEHAFEPRAGANHDEFHLALVQLGFSGLVTTNYDEVLESAVRQLLIAQRAEPHCEPLDLCGERSYRVFEFLRDLSQPPSFRWILHLHGHYRSPQRLILTLSDYRERYGEVVAFNERGEPLQKALSTLHRKVLWTLLVAHRMMFVGFSLEDRFFTDLLRIVQDDFGLGSDPVHFGIFPLKVHSDLATAVRRLQSLGISPLFYEVPPGDPDDHRGVRTLIYDLARAVGVTFLPSALRELSERTLEL